jgi:hypothetical protein
LNQAYYVTPAGGQTFTLSTGKSTGTLTSVASWNTASAGAGTNMIAHLLSNQTDGSVIPFKPGNTALALNLGAIMGTGIATAPLTLFGAPDLSTTLSTGVYGNPIGPGAYSVIATIGFNTPVLVKLNYDWIVASATTGTLVLLQN